jgi:hypothetical protein
MAKGKETRVLKQITQMPSPHPSGAGLASWRYCYVSSEAQAAVPGFQVRSLSLQTEEGRRHKIN